MKQTTKAEREYRVVAAGVFKATCLQLLDEVCGNRNLAILVTKRGKLVGQLIGPPEGITLSGPTVHKDDYPVGVVSTLQADARAAFEEYRTKKKEKKKKHK